jgi:hypothetical protein
VDPAAILAILALHPVRVVGEADGLAVGSVPRQGRVHVKAIALGFAFALLALALLRALVLEVVWGARAAARRCGTGQAHIPSVTRRGRIPTSWRQKLRQ